MYEQRRGMQLQWQGTEAQYRTGLGTYFNMSNLTPNNFIFLHACITSRYFYEISLTFTLSTVHRMTKDQSTFLDLGRAI